MTVPEHVSDLSAVFTEPLAAALQVTEQVEIKKSASSLLMTWLLRLPDPRTDWILHWAWFAREESWCCEKYIPGCGLPGFFRRIQGYLFCSYWVTSFMICSRLC